MRIDGKTKLCGVIGCPVEHTFSPAMHNAAYDYLGMNWCYVPFHVEPGRLAEGVRAVRSLGLAGVNVTVPHKQAVIPFLDRLDPSAELAGAVNTIVNSKGSLHGYNTDGRGFVAFLEREAGLEVKKSPALVLGAGGAARAVATAMAVQGTHEIIIAARRVEKAREIEQLLEGLTDCRVSVAGWPGAGDSREAGAWEDILGRVKLVIQTTPLGMHPLKDADPPFPYQFVGPGHVGVDLVYNPLDTLFLKRFKARGAAVYNGLGMLLYQGVLAFELFTGNRAPVEAMHKALGHCAGITEKVEKP